MDRSQFVNAMFHPHLQGFTDGFHKGLHQNTSTYWQKLAGDHASLWRLTLALLLLYLRWESWTYTHSENRMVEPLAASLAVLPYAEDACTDRFLSPYQSVSCTSLSVLSPHLLFLCVPVCRCRWLHSCGPTSDPLNFTSISSRYQTNMPSTFAC